jgi:hypothetical protein
MIVLVVQVSVISQSIPIYSPLTLCTYVILLSKVYHNDAILRQAGNDRAAQRVGVQLPRARRRAVSQKVYDLAREAVSWNAVFGGSRLQLHRT